MSSHFLFSYSPNSSIPAKDTDFWNSSAGLAAFLNQYFFRLKKSNDKGPNLKRH